MTIVISDDYCSLSFGQGVQFQGTAGSRNVVSRQRGFKATRFQGPQITKKHTYFRRFLFLNKVRLFSTYSHILFYMKEEVYGQKIVEHIFKLLHASSDIPLIKFNSGVRKEKLYRLLLIGSAWISNWGNKFKGVYFYKVQFYEKVGFFSRVLIIDTRFFFN